MNRLSNTVVHEICTNQVVVTLQACVKELVENSLDAKATRIEVRLRDSGAELLEVVDDGCGIAAEDFEKVASRHATSKIRQYNDLSSGDFSTFGFRGEALSAISAMGDLTIATKTKASAASLLCYDRYGKLASTSPIAREVGTTVSVRELFKRLPVRHKEFMRNAKSQVSATLRLIQSYAIAQPQVRFSVIAEKLRGPSAGKATLLCTSGTASDWHQAAAAVLGDAALSKTQKLNISAGPWQVEGLISSPVAGRRSRDAQLFFVNGRPIDAPKRVAKLINDTYHQYNSRAWPLVILSFTAPQGMVDVNVTPDKKQVFLHEEEQLLTELQPALTELLGISEVHGVHSGPSGPVLSHFGIRPSNAGSGDDGQAPNTPEPVRPQSPMVSRETPEKSQFFGEMAMRTLVPDSQSSTSTADDVPQMHVVEMHEGSQDASPERRRGHAADGATPSPLRSSVWSQPLKRRREDMGNLDLEVIELSLEEEMEPAKTEPDASEALPNAQGTAFQELHIEEYLPEPPKPSTSSAPLPAAPAQSPPAPPVSPAPPAPLSLIMPAAPVPPDAEVEAASLEDSEMKDAPSARPQQPQLASSFRTSVTLEGLRSGSRRRAVPARTQAGTEIAFPRAFSLAALREGEGASVEEVAKFGSEDGAAFRFDKSSFAKMRVIGQFNLGFIIGALQAEGSDGQQLFIVDQHASDEKFRFEALNRESRIERQPLVSSHPLQLTPAQEQLAEAHLEVFRMNGFELQKDEARPPGRRLRVTALPSCQGMVFNEKDIHDLLYKLEESEISQTSSSQQGLLDLDGHRALWSATALPRPQKVWTLLASKACRYATMVGKALRVSDMEKILRNLGTLRQPWNCPHGRPTMRHLADSTSARKAPKRAPLSVLKVDR